MQKQVCCFKQAIWLILMKASLKIKNRLDRYDINKPRPKYRHKYTKYRHKYPKYWTKYSKMDQVKFVEDSL